MNHFVKLIFLASITLTFANYVYSRCNTVIGRVRCANDKGEHDQQHALIRLVDTVSRMQDEAYSSRNGVFQVTACNVINPSLQVIHKCKSGRSRKAPFSIPATAEFHNITATIDLKRQMDGETDFAGPFAPPCV